MLAGEDLLREQGIDPEEATAQQRADAKASADELCQNLVHCALYHCNEGIGLERCAANKCAVVLQQFLL